MEPITPTKYPARPDLLLAHPDFYKNKASMRFPTRAEQIAWFNFETWVLKSVDLALTVRGEVIAQTFLEYFRLEAGINLGRVVAKAVGYLTAQPLTDEEAAALYRPDHVRGLADTITYQLTPHCDVDELEPLREFVADFAEQLNRFAWGPTLEEFPDEDWQRINSCWSFGQAEYARLVAAAYGEVRKGHHFSLMAQTKQITEIVLTGTDPIPFFDEPASFRHPLRVSALTPVPE